jgi:hypothetical protein
MIICTKASSDVFNVIELSAHTQWEPEQDFSQDPTKLVLPARSVEERSRGVFSKKLEDLQRVLHHYAAVAHPVKLRQLAHAARLGQPVTGEIRGQYPFSGREEEVLFTKGFIGEPALEHVPALLHVAFKSI